MSDAAKKMTKARSALVLDDPFWGSLSMRLIFEQDPTHPTAWVDGQTLGYNPEFVEGLDHAEVVALIAHEVGHCALGHPWRRDNRDPGRWNEACDRALNPDLRDAGFRLPEGCLFELEASHQGKPAEWVYNRLPEPEEESGQGQGQGQGEGEGEGQGEGEGEGQGEGEGEGQGSGNPQGEVRDAPKQGGGEGEGEDGASGAESPAPTEEDWRQAVTQAAVAAKARGDLPLGSERLLNQVSKPQVDWRSALRRFAQEAARADYSWKRPNARYMPVGIYLPALWSEEVGKAVVGMDTSGSVDDVMVSQGEAEIQAISEEVSPSEIHVMYCDARVHSTETFERGEPVKLHPRGGGGTDFRPVFAEIAKWDEPPAFLIYLTDMRGTFPKEDPGYPVLWVTGRDDAIEPPFGEVIAAL